MEKYGHTKLKLHKLKMCKFFDFGCYEKKNITLIFMLPAKGSPKYVKKADMMSSVILAYISLTEKRQMIVQIV